MVTSWPIAARMAATSFGGGTRVTAASSRIDGHEDLYDEEEMYRRLNLLRATGDTYVRDQPTTARLVQP